MPPGSTFRPVVLDRARVEHVAHLSRLDLPPEEADALVGHMQAMLDYVETLRAVDTTGLDPIFSPGKSTNVFREDTPVPSLTTDAALQAAPDAHAGGFRVPRVLGGAS